MNAVTKPAPHEPSKAGMIAPAPARLLALAMALALAAFIYANDRYLTGVHAMAVTSAIAAALAFATRRALLSTVLVAAFVALVSAIAYVKRERTDFILHAWDLFDIALWRFDPVELAVAHPFAMGAAALSVLVALIAPLALMARERANVRRRAALAGFVVFAAAGALAAYFDGGPRQMQFTFEDRNLSSFYSSWPEALETLARGHLLEAAPAAGSGAAFARPAPFDPRPGCAPQGRPPHIILIHQESVTPPAPLQGLDYDKALDGFFRSHDGRSHAMRVETYGGASWLTEFSVLTGAASRFFGSIRNFVQIYMAGRVDDALPAVLARCGYANMMFYPYVKGFFGSARFFETAGLRQIFDARDQKAPSAAERDSFYYANMLAEIGRRVERGEGPLFIYLQTMSAHWPYDVTYWPERDVRGGGPGTHPEMHEYLRRLAMAKQDYDALLKELAARFPDERFLVVHYGDHHPLATRFFFGLDGEEIEEINRRLPDASPAFVTYFAVDAVNHAPPALPAVSVLDSAYLGAVILEQARLPLPDSWRERARLMRACDGAYALCADRNAILRFHRRLIESGIVSAR